MSKRKRSIEHVIGCGKCIFTGRSECITYPDDRCPGEVQEFVLEDVVPVFDPNTRLSVFIAGPPGCGKSTAAAFIIKQRIKQHPNRPVILVTDIKGDDRSLEGVKMNKMRMEHTILSSITIEDIRKKMSDGAIFLFDDVDRIHDKQLSKDVYDLGNKILGDGRDHTKTGRADIDIIFTSHALNAGRDTKFPIENSEWFVIFPAKSLPRQVDLLLSKIGLKYSDVREMIGDEKYAVYIHKHAPYYIITNEKIIVL